MEVYVVVFHGRWLLRIVLLEHRRDGRHGYLSATVKIRFHGCVKKEENHTCLFIRFQRVDRIQEAGERVEGVDDLQVRELEVGFNEGL